MSTPYGPPGSERPQQWGSPQPHGYPQSGYPSSASQPYSQGHPQQQGYEQPGEQYAEQYGQQPYPAYGQQVGQSYPVGYGEPGYGGSGYGEPAYGGPDYGGPDYGGPDYGGPQKNSALPWILSGVGAIAVAVVILVLGFVAPGFFTTTVFDRNAVQQGVQRILSDGYGQNVQAVTCPADQKVQPGSTFVCQATIDGVQRDVTITVKSDAGEYEVARPS